MSAKRRDFIEGPDNFASFVISMIISLQLPRKKQYNFGVKEIKVIIQLAGAVLLELHEAQAAEKADMGK